jgi:hypothetical protein
MVMVIMTLVITAPLFAYAEPVLPDVSFEDLSPTEQRNLETFFASQNQGQSVGDSATTTSTGAVNCFDYYNFNSVQVSIVPTVQETVAGATIDFSGTITNNNPYPVVNGRLYAKMFRLRENREKNQNGHHLVDRFVIAENMALQANAEQPVTFSWSVPAWAMDGTYEVAMFFITENRYNLLGLSFTDDIVGNTTTFDVRAQTNDAVMFNKDTVTVNSVPHLFAGFPNRFSRDEPVTITAALENKSAKPVEIPVVMHVYAWDAMHPDHYLETIEQTIRIPAGKTAPVSITVSDTSHPVYFVEIISRYRDAKSILNVRFVREGVNKLRINFPSTFTYPLSAEQPATIFACMHNTSDAFVQGTLRLQVLDLVGNVLHTDEYQGMISGSMDGFATTFTPKKSYESFRVKAELFEGDTLVETDDIWYECDELNTCNSVPKPMWWDMMFDIFNAHKTFILSVLGGALLIFLGMVVYLWSSSRKTIHTKL